MPRDDFNNGGHNFQMENKVRCGKITTCFHDRFNWFLMCVLNFALMAVDTLLRWLSKADSRVRECPLIFHLVLRFARNPIWACLREISTAMGAHGHASRLISAWRHQNRHHRYDTDEGWWVKSSIHVFILFSQQHGRTALCMAYRVNDFPYAIFKPAAAAFFFGRDSPQHIAQSHTSATASRCCAEECGIKVLDMVAGDARRFREGRLAQALEKSAPDMFCMSLRCERFFAAMRHFNSSHFSTGFVATSNGFTMKRLAGDHVALGGALPHMEATQKDMQGLGTHHEIRQADPDRFRGCSNNGFMLYMERVVGPEWHELLGKEAMPASARPRTRAEEDTRWVVGQWLNWEDFLALKTAEYHKSPGVKGYWRAVAADQANAKMACSAEEAKAKPTGAPTRKPLQRQDAIWQAGNSDTPVRCELVRDVLEARRKKTHASHPRARGDVGPASTARAIADEQCPTLLVSDSRETVGDLQPIELKKTCGRGHPGMCAATHVTVYQATEEICVNLTTLFSHCQKRDALGRILCFTCYHGPGPRVHQWSVVTTEVRFARPAIQMVACTDSLGEGRFKIRCDEWGMSDKSSYHAVADELMELTAKHNIDTSDIDQVVVNEGFYAPQIADMPDVLGTWAPFPEALFRKFRPHLQWGVDREIYPHVIPPSERKGRRKRTPEDGDELDKLFKSIKSEKEKNKERMDKWKAALSKLKKIGKVAKKAVKAYQDGDPGCHPPEDDAGAESDGDAPDGSNDGSDESMVDSDAEVQLDEVADAVFKRHGHKVVKKPRPKPQPTPGDGPDDGDGVGAAGPGAARQLDEVARQAPPVPVGPPVSRRGNISRGAAQQRTQRDGNWVGWFGHHNIRRLTKPAADGSGDRVDDGLSIECHQHLDTADLDKPLSKRDKCCADVHRGTGKKMLTNEQIELCLKRWIILGAEVPTSAPDARSLHQRPVGKSRMWVRQLAKTRLTEEQRAMAQVLHPDEVVSAL